jgi:hypothetical protein
MNQPDFLTGSAVWLQLLWRYSGVREITMFLRKPILSVLGAISYAIVIMPFIVSSSSAQHGTLLINLHTGLPSGSMYCIGSPPFGTQWGFDIGYIIQPNTAIIGTYDQKRFSLDESCFYSDFSEELRNDNLPAHIAFEPEQKIPERFYSLSIRHRLADSTNSVSVYGVLGLTLCHVPSRKVIVGNARREFRWIAPETSGLGLVYGAGLDIPIFNHLGLFFDFRNYSLFKEVDGYKSLDVFNTTIGVAVNL